MKTIGTLSTPSGDINFPAYIPVTTFGKKYPLDNLIRPYLPRLAPAIMVSMHYAKQMKEKPKIPVMIDSGGFASLFEFSKVIKTKGLGIIKIKTEEKTTQIHPADVLDFQEQHADVAFTLDFIITPGMKPRESKKRLELTIANAIWAIENRRKTTMPLYACVQSWDAESAKECAKSYKDKGFDGIAIGGLVPRSKDQKAIISIIEAVRSEITDLPIHVFGLGTPDIVEVLFKMGVSSVDSSSYVKAAVQGQLWYKSKKVENISAFDRLHIALCNLAIATGRTLPLSSSKLFFSTQLLN